MLRPDTSQDTPAPYDPDKACAPSGASAGRAAVILSGVQRMLAELGWASLPEFGLGNGRRADVLALSPSGEIVIVEIKSCLADFQSDQKWPDYRAYCDRFYFAVDAEFPQERLPTGCGLMVADAFGGAVVREDAPAPVAAARRKALTLSFARLAAARLLRADLATRSTAWSPDA